MGDGPAYKDGRPYRRADFVTDLRALRMRQTQFAEKVGLTHYTVSHWDLDSGCPMPQWVPVLVDAWLELAALRGVKR